jgi:hypothetical protein
MKTPLVIVTMAAVTAAGYFYFNPRQVVSAPAQPPSVAAEVPSAEPAIVIAHAPEPVDDRQLVVILRERVRWPTELILTRPLRVPIVENGAAIGEAVIEIGRTLRATALTDAGKLKVWIGDRVMEVPYEDTDFVERAAATPPPTAKTSPTESVPVRVAGQRRTTNFEQRLAELKAAFPPKRSENAFYLKDKIYSTTPTRTTVTQAIGNSAISTATTGTGVRVSGKLDTSMIEVPHPDVHSYYKGMVQTATLQSLPISLQRIEARIEGDLTRLRGETHSLSNTIHATQARGTVAWINGTLRPYLAQLKSIAEGK